MLLARCEVRVGQQEVSWRVHQLMTSTLAVGIQPVYVRLESWSASRTGWEPGSCLLASAALSLHDYTSHRRGCRVDRLHRLHPPHGAGMDRFLPISPRPRRTC